MKPLDIRKEDFKLEANDQPLFIMNTPISNYKLLDLEWHCFFYQSSKYLMPVCAVANFLGELNIAAPMCSWPRPTTIFKKSNFNHGACLKDIPMKSGMLVAQIQ